MNIVKMVVGPLVVVNDGSAVELANLADVLLTDLQDQQIIAWDETAGKWVNVDNTGGGGAVASVNGKTGVVVLAPADIGLGNVNNTSDANKPISTATQTALNLKANSADIPTNNNQLANGAAYVNAAGAAAAAPVQSVAGKTGMVTLAKGDVGLNNVDNTADSAKPVSSAQGVAISAKLTIPTGNPSTQVLNGVGVPVDKPKYEALSALPGDLSGYPDGSRIVITG